MAFSSCASSPDLATEITITPVERLGVDAAILFADILLVLEPMGVGLEYSKGDGPVLHRPVRSAQDVDGLRDFDVAKSFRLFTKRSRKSAKNSKTKCRSSVSPARRLLWRPI